MNRFSFHGDFEGPWAGLPIAWNARNEFDERTYRDDVARCCQAGVSGVYTGGTTGEFYALEFDEFQRVAAATIEICHDHQIPAMIGCTATHTLGAVRQANLAAALGADAIQVALPFWMPVHDTQIIPFFESISAAAGHLPLSIYDVARAQRTLSTEKHFEIKDRLANYAMVKATAGTVGSTPEGCRQLSSRIRVFAGETLWPALAPHGVAGACSAMVYWNPRLVLELWQDARRDPSMNATRELCEKVAALHTYLAEEFAPRGFTDTAFDRLCGVAFGFLRTSLRCREPYVAPTLEDVARLRNWCSLHFPEIMTQ